MAAKPRNARSAAQSGWRRAPGFLVAGLAGLLLTACDPDPEYLIGQREGLRDVLVEPDDQAPSTSQARPIRLPAAKPNPEWAQFWGNAGVRPVHPALSATPQVQWSQSIGTANSRRQRITASPVVGGGRIFTMDAAATVTAVSPAGDVLWSRDLTPDTDSSEQATGGGLAFADGRLYVSSGFGFLAVLDAADGSEIWLQDLQATGSGAPTVRGDLVYLTAGDDTGWAIEKDTGRIAWQIGAGASISNVLGAPAPVLNDDLAIFSFGSGDVQAVFRRGGLRRWDAAVVGERRGYALSRVGDITAPPVIDGTRVYTGNQSGRTVALSVATGARLWTAQHGAITPLWPVGGSVFMVSDRNRLMRLSAEDGSVIWDVELPNFITDRPRRRVAVFAHYAPIVAGGRVVLLSSDGAMRSFDPADGTLLNTIEIPGGAASAPAIAGGALYVVTTRGELLAFR